MSLLYENTKCPVCDKVFEPDDDIVTCPDCGTPHHRECYNAKGHCANKELHKEGFVFKRTPPVQNEESSSAQAKEDDANKRYPIGSYYEPDAKLKDQKTKSDYAPSYNLIRTDEKGRIKIDKDLDGVLLADASTVVGMNSRYYIQNFIKNRRISWNWSAFVFGPYYLFFRKMHLQGIMFMALQLVCRLIVSVIYSKQIYAFSNLYLQLFKIDDLNEKVEFMSKLYQSSEFEAYKPAAIIFFVCLLLIRIVIGLIANSVYCKKVLNIVQDVDEKVNSGKVFSFNPLMGTEMNMNQSEMRKLFLSKQGGVSIIAPMLAYTVFYLVTTII